MVQMNKRAFLFTVVTFFLLFSVMMFAKAFMYREAGLAESMTMLYAGTKMGIISDDVISNVFSDLLTVDMRAITRTASLLVAFNRTELTAVRNYQTIFTNYQNYVTSTYANQNGISIDLSGFNNSFTIQPYGTIYRVDGQNMYLYFKAPYTDIVSINVEASIGSEHKSACFAPVNSGTISVTITYTDSTGWTCTDTKSLSATTDNNLGTKQFQLDLKNSPGSIDTKFGQVDGINGVLAILPLTANVNVTRLDITYTLPASNVYLESGTLTLNSLAGNFTRTSKIILAQE
jgi:hypothetical protein